jgi:hypothetical protein
MTCWKWLLGAVVVLGLARGTLAADPIKDDPQLSADQKKYLAKFQASLEARPTNPNEGAKHLQNVQSDLKKLFAVNNSPSARASDELAATLVRGFNDGNISAGQSVALAKELSKVLQLKEITYQATNQFVRNIEPVVQQTGLRSSERMRLYTEALRVVKSTPTYAPQ